MCSTGAALRHHAREGKPCLSRCLGFAVLCQHLRQMGGETRFSGFVDRRGRLRALVTAALCLNLMVCIALALSVITAFAHHPGSHAFRQGDGRVKLESVVTVPDGCTFIGAVTTGTPSGQTAPPDAYPITVKLRRSDAGSACTMALKVLKDDSMLSVPAGQARLHLFVVAADGKLASTERVPIR
jgi:hypothetical protein